MSTVLIVGADRGIAAAMVDVYRQRGDEVIAACLGDGSVWGDTPVRVCAGIDVTDDVAVATLAEQLTGTSLDVLVHVAGIGSIDRYPDFDFGTMLEHYNLNALGPLRVVSALADNLAEGARVGIVTSRMGSIGDNGSGRMYSYRMSKAAANMLGVNLYHELKPRGVAVMLLHPGTVATAMTKGARNWDDFTRPEEAALGLVTQLDQLDPDASPTFRHASGELLPW
jgi:NAD(P)-dependent dehydrogenase (short-subunit alcohol dehydrogenase family)